MGHFSFITTDTNRSIYNNFDNKNFPVYMLDNLGNVWVEPDYEGYGEFGGKDIYELFAEMNHLIDDINITKNDAREIGINAWFSDTNFDKGYIYPNLVQNCELEWSNKKLEHCPNNGMFISQR